MNNYFREIKPVLNKLQRLNVFESLDVVRKYVYASIYRKRHEYICGIDSPLYYGIEVYTADFFIKNIIIYSTIVRGEISLSEVKTRKIICKPIEELQQKINHNRMKEQPTVWVSSYFFNQINMQPEGNEKLMLYRQYYIYNEPSVKKVVEETLGYPLLHFFRMLLFLYAVFVNHFCHPIEHLFMGTSSDNDLDVVALKHILAILSKPLSELKELCKDELRYDEDRILGYYNDSPHIKYPLISFEQKAYCVVPSCILFSAFDYLYHILNQNSSPQSRDLFAKRYEEYIGEIFSYYFENSKIEYTHEITYKYRKYEKLTSDWIVWDDTDICFIDCKIKKITIEGQRANTIDRDLLDTIIREKPYTSAKKKEISQIPEGLTKDIINYGIDLGKIFVCYDDYEENRIESLRFMPGKKYHMCLLTLEQNFCNAYEIRNDIIKIAQSYRDFKTGNHRCILDEDVMIISTREIERYIPIIADVGIAKFVELKKNGSIDRIKENNEFLRTKCKTELLDELLQDINAKANKMNQYN